MKQIFFTFTILLFSVFGYSQSLQEAAAALQNGGVAKPKPKPTQPVAKKTQQKATPQLRTFTETVLGVSSEMVYVEGGTFQMGCTGEQSDCYDEELPVHSVTLNGYYIAATEVTQELWQKVMGTSVYQQRDKVSTSWPIRDVGPNYPMYYVSWEEAMLFCRELSRLTGKTYTLPTEAQWEFAARGGNKSKGYKYSGSNSIGDVAWYTSNSSSKTHAVGTKAPNELGIYDMSGNVWEWCKDWYASSYVSYDTNNPEGPSSGSGRVIRGGSWINPASHCRVSNRSYNAPSDRDYRVGFRVVLLP